MDLYKFTRRTRRCRNHLRSGASPRTVGGCGGNGGSRVKRFNLRENLVISRQKIINYDLFSLWAMWTGSNRASSCDRFYSSSLLYICWDYKDSSHFYFMKVLYTVTLRQVMISALIPSAPFLHILFPYKRWNYYIGRYGDIQYFSLKTIFGLSSKISKKRERELIGLGGN